MPYVDFKSATHCSEKSIYQQIPHSGSKTTCQVLWSVSLHAAEPPVAVVQLALGFSEIAPVPPNVISDIAPIQFSVGFPYLILFNFVSDI